MSLFKARDLWSTRCGKDEIYNQSSIAIADFCSKGYDYIVIGSQNGFLRVFSPQPEMDPNYTGFKPTDQLIETQLSQPILHVAVGKLVSGSSNYHIGVLHPQSFAAYSLLLVAGSAEHGDQSQLVLVYEHHLKRSAFSLLVGPFGGGTGGRDFACIQSLDGTLSFYEQESFAFRTALPQFLLPSPIAYIPRSDAFIILNADWHLESYKYESLGGASSRKLVPSWSYNLGEEVIDMRVLATPEAAIVVLTGHNLHCFRDGGSLQFTKRLLYTPLCCHPFLIEQDHRLMMMIASDTQTLLVYEHSTLRWAAQLPFSPVALERVNLQMVQGLVVAVSEDGVVQCLYLGTEPGLFVPPPLETKDANLLETEHTLQMLQQQIAAYSSNNKDATEELGSQHELAISVRVLSAAAGGDGECTVRVQLMPYTPLSAVQVTLNTNSPFAIQPEVHCFSTLFQSAEVTSVATLEAGPAPFSLEVVAVVTWCCGREGAPRVVQTSAELPLSLLLLPAAPSKQADTKITLTTSSSPAPLSLIFQELVGELWNSCGCSDTAAGFSYRCASETSFTVIISKNSQRYRLQADSAAALHLPVTLLVSRLEKSRMTVSHAEGTLPIPQLMDMIDKHSNLRITAETLQEELGLQASQYRVIERRLLSKLRDKVPSPLSGLELLLADSYASIMAASHNLEQALNAVDHSGTELSCIVRLILLLLKLSGTVSCQDLADLSAALVYTLHSAEGQGWEEVSEAGVSYLLRTSLAKCVRDHQRTPVHSVLHNVDRLKRHIAAALDRLVTGSHRAGERVVSPIMESDEQPSSTGDHSKAFQANPWVDESFSLGAEVPDEADPELNW